MKKYCLLAILLGVSIPKAYTSADGMKLKIAKCAQDITDFGHGGFEGIRVAAKTLDLMVTSQRSNLELFDSCKDYLKSNLKVKPNREEQLKILSELKEELTFEVYFFLRGTIRPLISCRKTAKLFRKCTSATGKRWLEITLKEGSRDKIDYRLGHTDGGLIVRGPQNYLDQEDVDYLNTLPREFTTGAEESLRNELERNYLKIKILKKAGTSMFLRHYLLRNNHQISR